MRGVMARSYYILAWITLIGVALQFYWAGLALFDSASAWELHISLGHTLGGPLILLLITGLVGRLGRRTIGLTVLLFALYVLQIMLPGLRGNAPLVAALHPINALAVLGMSGACVRDGRALLHARVTRPAASVEPSAIPTSERVESAVEMQRR